MRKLISLIITYALSALSIASCAGNQTETSETKEENKPGEMTESIAGKKTLVAFFSHTGENYGVGNITEGNTHIIAKLIGEATNGTLFEIVPEKDYPHDSYDKVVEIAKQEKAANARPTIKDDVNVEDYDVIFIGYPNWWGDMPMPVYTFLEKHNWDGKTVVPFCTHEGSGLSKTEKYVAETCCGAKVRNGLAVRGETAQNKRDEARKAVKAWLDRL